MGEIGKTLRNRVRRLDLAGSVLRRVSRVKLPE